MDLSFPTQEHLSPEQYNVLRDAACYLYSSQLTKAEEGLNALSAQIDAQNLKQKAILIQWQAKLHFTRGEYLKAYELLEALVKDLVTEEAQIKSQEGKV